MSGSEDERGKAVSVRLMEALNAHDLEGQLGLLTRITEVSSPSIQREHSADAHRCGRIGRRL
jgi:hypothetical protein